MPSTSALLLLADQFRERSQQVALGMSGLGQCRRRAGYQLMHIPPVNRVGSVQAVMGSAIHDAVADAVRRLGKPGDLVEYGVGYAGLRGRLDRYEAESQTVIDTKTCSTRWLEHIKIHGPSLGHRWQLSFYSAALITQDVPVKACRLEYLVRDSGNEYDIEWQFDMQDVKDALDWLRDVRATPLPMLPRDEDPDSPMCRGCPYGGADGGICWVGHVPNRDFRSVYLAEGVDSGDAAAELFEIRQQVRELKKREERLKGVLDGERPDGPWDVVKAGDHWLKWSKTRGAGWSLRFVSQPSDTLEDE